jgi:hypothetical protein
LSESKSLKSIQREYGVTPFLIRTWKEKKDLYIASSHKSTSFKAIKNGGISSTYEYDGIIASYIKNLRANRQPVNATDIILYAKKIVVDFKDRFIKSLLSWTKRFIKRMGFCYRNVTKAKTNIKEDIIDYVKKFYVITRKVIEPKNLLLTKENIGNADETPIFMEMNAKKTLSLIGEKDISIKTFNKSHTRIIVMLNILGNGKSLKPFVVF